MQQSQQSRHALLLAVRAAERDWRISQHASTKLQAFERNALDRFALRVAQCVMYRIGAMHTVAARWHRRRARISRASAGAG